MKPTTRGPGAHKISSYEILNPSRNFCDSSVQELKIFKNLNLDLEKGEHQQILPITHLLNRVIVSNFGQLRRRAAIPVQPVPRIPF